MSRNDARRQRQDFALCAAPREISLADIDQTMKRIKARIKTAIPEAHITEGVAEKVLVKPFVRSRGVQITIEVTPVLGGCLFEPETTSVAPAVEEELGFAEVQVVSFADLYAGKIVAALDRQHPRDFFDARDLLAGEGMTDDLRQAFIVYLLSHHRPMAEVLAPPRKDISEIYHRGLSA